VWPPLQLNTRICMLHVFRCTNTQQMDFYMNDEVRSFAIAIQPDLINCAVCALKANMTTVDVVRAIFAEVSCVCAPLCSVVCCVVLWCICTYSLPRSM
jgi:hypothetical protein